MNDRNERTLYCGNLDERVIETHLNELFTQSGPVESVHIPRPRKDYGFIVFKHKESVNYAKELFEGTKLFGKMLRLAPKDNVAKGEEPYTKMMKEYSCKIPSFYKPYPERRTYYERHDQQWTRVESSPLYNHRSTFVHSRSLSINETAYQEQPRHHSIPKNHTIPSRNYNSYSNYSGTFPNYHY